MKIFLIENYLLKHCRKGQTWECEKCRTWRWARWRLFRKSMWKKIVSLIVSRGWVCKRDWKWCRHYFRLPFALSIQQGPSTGSCGSTGFYGNQIPQYFILPGWLSHSFHPIFFYCNHRRRKGFEFYASKVIHNVLSFVSSFSFSPSPPFRPINNSKISGRKRDSKLPLFSLSFFFCGFFFL